MNTKLMNKLIATGIALTIIVSGLLAFIVIAGSNVPTT